MSDANASRRPIMACAAPPVTIGTAARRCGLTTRAIRFYEERGLINPIRDPYGVRFFDAETLERLTFIALARTGGLTIEQISALVRASPHSWIEEALRLCRTHLEALDERKRQVEGVIGTLSMRRAALATNVFVLDPRLIGPSLRKEF